ncbi:MAG: 1,4-alpha-glucan branching protein GlgB [Bauldia sp.]|uniref:1,4-alpha-glucan branching protein GlgB n=1 Tax=Bauldia sp. TaxID=2575872 RepID=UPI001DD68218|nr:1,4-alpha-glucan branching protein GlgB [Bauldia sp.]MCB1495069.1 1,4-alpha-glucan branching protein GlgB [Bauldia sp.]
MARKAANLPTWRPDDATIDAIVQGRHGDPFALLGMHTHTNAPVSVRLFSPGAEEARIIDKASGKDVATLERLHPDGFFAGPVPRRRKPFPYLVEFTNAAASWRIEDPYRFPSLLGDIDVHLMGEGRHRRIYDHLGAHQRILDGVEGVTFGVWAPNARRVSVVGDFNFWDGRRHPMRKHLGIGVWEIFIPGVGPDAVYKYEILGADGVLRPLKADPIAFAQEKPPATASRVVPPAAYQWSDEAWLAARQERQGLGAPVSVYEVHLGSWRRKEGNQYLSYADLADQLVAYATDMGFTHLELMPVSEYPFDGSWGYQPIGLFAPTSRFGPPAEFARFVDRCHGAGLGVIIDWVPAHFPTDAHGLMRFDGTALYEHQDPRLGFHRDWNTLIYNFGRNEVRNFLIANALFWLDRFHIDALRVDAVASMLYLDYSRNPGEWIPNVHGGRENLEAIAFLRELNTVTFGDYPGTTTIAEESTSWPQVSRPVDGGGLGFGYKWNMGWMHDTLEYMKHEPVHRRYHHHQMTFGIHYAYSENFVLPLSHDEVVHGKGSLIGKMPGDAWQKFANLRAYFGFMWTHPGKKLLFMGGEFAQEREWNHDQSLDWHLLDHAPHREVQALVRDLNHLYRSLPALHVRDADPGGFEWVEATDADNSVYAYLRFGNQGDAPVLVVCNFTPVVREGYRLGVPRDGRWVERLNTDAAAYGGSNVGNGGAVVAESTPWQGRPASLSVTLPPLATVVLEHSA